jgi:hypothetical protein
MTPRHMPLALALLERSLPDDDPLLGDLLEECRHRSPIWFWWQVLGAVATRALRRSNDIRPLRLVDEQPLDAMARSYRLQSRVRPVNLSASPLADVGGLGLVVLTLHVSIVVPGAWWALLAAMASGVGLGAVLIAVHAPRAGRMTTLNAHLRAH